jgi:hypothetical protein
MPARADVHAEVITSIVMLKARQSVYRETFRDNLTQIVRCVTVTTFGLSLSSSTLAVWPAKRVQEVKDTVCCIDAPIFRIRKRREKGLIAQARAL